jgi:4-hydroxybenzoate polyprenyltransferase
MKLTSKTLPQFIWLLLLSCAVGTLGWELIERIVELAGGRLGLSVGPVGFDIRVIAVSVMVNPGTLLGLVPGYLLFRRL